jgi:hypothetical protein
MTPSCSYCVRWLLQEQPSSDLGAASESAFIPGLQEGRDEEAACAGGGAQPTGCKNVGPAGHGENGHSEPRANSGCDVLHGSSGGGKLIVEGPLVPKHRRKLVCLIGCGYGRPWTKGGKGGRGHALPVPVRNNRPMQGLTMTRCQNTA